MEIGIDRKRLAAAALAALMIAGAVPALAATASVETPARSATESAGMRHRRRGIPEGATVQSDGTLVLSDGTVVQRKGRREHGIPEGATVQSDGTLILSDGTVVQRKHDRHDADSGDGDGTTRERPEERPERPIRRPGQGRAAHDAVTGATPSAGTI